MVLLLLLAGVRGLAQQAGAQTQQNLSVQSEQRQVQGRPAYSLPPEKLARAVAYSRIRILLHFGSSAWGILALVLLLASGAVGGMQRAALRAGGNRWVQGGVFVLLLLAATTLLELPLDLFAQHEAVVYGQSVQSWGSWAADLSKGLLLSLVVGIPVVMLLFWVIGRSPARWWFWFWIPAMVLVLLSVFVAPVLIDPMFNSFEPLSKTDPALVERLEKVVERGGVSIPPERMYLMKASDKVTSLNAYVTGVGASKRVVVWDNTIARATPDEISFIFGHELGHYVLNHIPKTLAFVGAILLAGFYVGYRGVRWMIARYGGAWGVRSENDWGALAVLLLVLSVLSFLSEPLVNGFSRHNEHEADVYGQEAIHGIVADPQSTAQQAFQLLGEVSLTDPHPSPLIEFWAFSHPSIARRAAFAAEYNPWIAHQRPRFFSK